MLALDRDGERWERPMSCIIIEVGNDDNVSKTTYMFFLYLFWTFRKVDSLLTSKTVNDVGEGFGHLLD